MTSTPPLDDWESVGNEEHLDVKELKSQIYDLKQKLTLADARESTLLKDKKDIQSELDDTKKKVSVLQEMNSKQKLQLLSADVGEKNLVLLKEEIEKSGQMKVEIMQLKQTIKEMNSKQKLQLLSTDAGEKNLVMLKEEIERSGELKRKVLQMEQIIKEKGNVDGMLNAKTKELDLAKGKISIYRDAIKRIGHETDLRRLESIRKVVVECKNATK